MKSDKITKTDLERWKKAGKIPAACRLCGEVNVFPKGFYKPEQLQSYECSNCKAIRRLFGRE